MSDWRPGASQAALEARAEVFAQIRDFFRRRKVMEVDTPVLASHTVTDVAIDPLELQAAGEPAYPRFLQSSPEFAMKRLLAAGSGDIYQLGKVFRHGERGSRHNPEFTMLEWYRVGFTSRGLMEEVADLMRACLGPMDCEFHSYAELFQHTLGLCPHRAKAADLKALAEKHLSIGNLSLDRDGWLDLLMSHCIEPQLAGQRLVFVYDYPPSQAALARCHERDGVSVADRFELYVGGLEMANGYRELLGAEELKQRAAADNERRAASGLRQRDLDLRLVAAMDEGLPDCSGVALGVDRLIMAKLGVDRIAEVMPFDWSRA